MSLFSSGKKLGASLAIAAALAMAVSGCNGDGDSTKSVQSLGGTTVVAGPSHAFEQMTGPAEGLSYEQAKESLARDIMLASDPYEMAMVLFAQPCLADRDGWSDAQRDNMALVVLNTPEINQNVADVMSQQDGWSRAELEMYFDWQSKLQTDAFGNMLSYCASWTLAKQSLQQTRG